MSDNVSEGVMAKTVVIARGVAADEEAVSSSPRGPNHSKHCSSLKVKQLDNDVHVSSSGIEEIIAIRRGVLGHLL